MSRDNVAWVATTPEGLQAIPQLLLVANGLLAEQFEDESLPVAPSFLCSRTHEYT